MVLAETVPLSAAKPILYTFSLLPGLSRLQTESHYPSQIFLGWSFAYASATHTRIEDIPAYIKPIKP
jgi:membrane-associated phospholipid phosphatase